VGAVPATHGARHGPNSYGRSNFLIGVLLCQRIALVCMAGMDTDGFCRSR